ncbi:MAG: hypothetical protein ACI8XM_000930 [Haloarculaceae archaeon]|jgi:hypothetical protein
MVRKIFPEDDGTGLNDQTKRDWADGANLAALGHADATSQVVVAGMAFTPDYTNDELTISDGQARVTAFDVETRTRDGVKTVWPEVTFAVRTEQETIALTAGAVNEIWLDVQLSGSPDTYSFETSEPTSAPKLKVGEVDTANDTATELNRLPDGEFETLTVASEPSSNDDVARKLELDGKADDQHAATHAEGGGDELDAADLSGSKGTDGQVLQTDGSAASWGDTGGIGASDVRAYQYVLGGE